MPIKPITIAQKLVIFQEEYVIRTSQAYFTALMIGLMLLILLSHLIQLF